MIKVFKINTAILICLTFIFRLLFTNIGIISSLNTQQNKRIVKTHFSTVIKKRRHIDALNNLGNAGYSVMEICEEDGDEGKQFKSNPFVLLQILYSSVANKINIELKKISHFYSYFSDTSPRRYLAYQVFRV